jgi:glycosyltransferase involved in cell wall biosynthesis
MKKILIISYYFEPCSLTASQRTTFWARNLTSFGYYPIIITRNWNNNISKPEDVFQIEKNEYNFKKTETHDVFYLPYIQNLRDRILLSKNKNLFLSFLQKILTFKDLIKIHFSKNLKPINSFLNQTEKIVKKEDIYGIIISGAPFDFFKIGYLIEKKYKTPWIADYRDDWSTNEVLTYSFFQKIVLELSKKSERKWISTASAITSVSDHYTNKISKFNNKIGYTIENGFSEYITNPLIESEHFIVLYNGTLYKSQPIEPFMDAFIKFSSDKNNVKLKFIGAAFDEEQKERLTNYLLKLNDKLIITNRVEKEKIIEEQKKASILLMFSHKNCKGIPSSKLYEYFSFGKHILCYPRDHDIIDEKLNDYELGYTTDNEIELVQYLNEKYQEFSCNNLKVIQTSEDPFIQTQTRLFQTKKLAEVLNKHF